MRGLLLCVWAFFAAGCSSSGGGGPDPADWVGEYDLVWTCESPGGCETSTGIPPVITTWSDARIWQPTANDLCRDDPEYDACVDRVTNACDDCPLPLFDGPGGGSNLVPTGETYSLWLRGDWISCTPTDNPIFSWICRLTLTETGFEVAATYQVVPGETYDWSLRATRR